MKLIERLELEERQPSDRPYQGFEVSIYEDGRENPVETSFFPVDDEGFASASYGRDPSNDIFLPSDLSVSSNHGDVLLQDKAKMEYTGDGDLEDRFLEGKVRIHMDHLVLRDNSSFGTFRHVAGPHRPDGQNYVGESTHLLDVGDRSDRNIALRPGSNTYLTLSYRQV